MVIAAIEQATTRVTRDFREQTTARRVALLGGTTKLSDCLVAARYLASPRQLIQGPMIAEYEKAFARQVGVGYACSFSSGRVGLYGLLRLFGVGPGDEVLLQVPTHIVVSNAIRYTGARPVYVDCRLDSYNIDLEQAERLFTPRTKVLILQHTFGIPVDLEAALALARRRGLKVIEDCVHALGATYDGRQVGSFGDAAFFSTEETKIISTTMGGMVVTDDPGLAARIRAFQATCAWPRASLVAQYVLKLVLYHVLTEPHLYRATRLAYERLGRRSPLPGPATLEEIRGSRPPVYEQRLSNAQAALGLLQLRRLDANLSHRRSLARQYQSLLSERGIQTLQVPERSQPSYVRYPVWVADRDAVTRTAAPYAVLGTWFTSVLEQAISPAYGDYEIGRCPMAEEAARHLVNLPTHPRVTLKDAKAIASAVASAELRSGSMQPCPRA
jgi:perosamine synthetase